MNSGNVGEKGIFSHFSHVKNSKVEKINFCDIVLVLQDESVCNQWPMARVIQVFKHSNRYVGSIKFRIGKNKTLIKVIEFWKELSQKLCCLLNRSVFNSSMRKCRKGVLVQDNSVIFNEPCVDAPWWSAPKID